MKRAARLAVLFATFAATPALVRAQQAPETWSKLAIKHGATLVVVDTTVRATQGQFAFKDDSSIALETPGGQLRLTRGQVARIDRVGDPLLNGTLIGAGAGFVAGIAVTAFCRPECGSRASVAGGIVLVAAEGALIGMLIDFLSSGRTTIYNARPSAK